MILDQRSRDMKLWFEWNRIYEVGDQKQILEWINSVVYSSLV
jgi:hypothetical protein